MLGYSVVCVKYKTQKIYIYINKFNSIFIDFCHLLLELNGPILDKAFTSGPKRGNGIPVGRCLFIKSRC